MYSIIQKIRARKVPILIFLVGLFLGMVLGIVISPAKRGLVINCKNSYATKEKKKNEEFHEDLAMEMGELR